jgi:16S rRNA (guanine527-N7)-methyltransferase
VSSSSIFRRDDEPPPPPPPTLEEKLVKWFPNLAAIELELLGRFEAELLKFNKTINLISPNTIKTLDVVHFADCIQACDLIFKKLHPDAPLYDFGSGNGFPGIIFGILYPSVNVILVERDARKAEFLKHCRSYLGLQNVEVRVMDVKDLPKGSIKNVMARGYAPLHKVMILNRHQLVIGGRFFHLKSDAWAQELAGVPSQVFTVWTASLVGSYKLPETGAPMAVVITEKVTEA